jgi:hypothetical protein
MKKLEHISRRRVLRGLLAGSAVTVGLPFLDCFLNVNGTALAATGSPLPTCFGTWFWGLGFPPGHWEPKQAGADYMFPPMLAELNPFRHKLAVFSGLQVETDGKANFPHVSGPQATFTGDLSETQTNSAKSLDVIIADAIATGTRFRSIQVACDGNSKSSMSFAGPGALNPAEVSPLELYTRIFGSEFVDPNAAEFTPDPKVMLRASALSAVTEQRKSLLRWAGAEDRRRLDQYFTSLRDLENKLEVQLQKPAPMQACTIPKQLAKAPKDPALLDAAMERHDLFVGLLAHALACGQTRVFNVAITEGMSGLKTIGDPTNHHTHSHEEPIDPKLGYQPITAAMSAHYVTLLRNLLAAMDGIREGEGTLLDRVLLFAATDHGEARLHGLQNIPIFLAGGAGGKAKLGVHVPLRGQPITRVGLTAQHLMGVSVSRWGTRSNQAATPITEIMA